MTPRKPKPPRVDWAFGPGTSPTMGAVNAAFAATNATAIGWMLHANPGWGAGLGALMAAGSLVALGVDRHRQHTIRPAVIYRVACWTTAGLWSAVQLGHRPWSWVGVMVLAIGAGIAAIIGEALRAAEQRREETAAALRAALLQQDRDWLAAQMAAATPTLPEHEQRGLQWQALMRRICRMPDLAVVACQMWPTGDGYTLEFIVPDDGSTVADVKARTTELATAAGLEPGCNVEVIGNIPGKPRRVGQARVNTRNAMAESQPFPGDLSPRSIVDPVHLGVAADRTPLGISVHQDSAAIVGQRGSGKSTTLNVFVAGGGRCTNAIILAIDTKGGGEMPRRWMQAAYEGRADRPVIALCANTNELAALMVKALLNVTKGRPTYYAQLMRQQDALFVQATPDVPQILLVVDEFKSLPMGVKDDIELLIDTGRSAGVQVVNSSLDATAAGIPPGILKQTRERVGMRFSDEAQIQYLFDKTWRSGRFDTAAMTDPGMGLISTNAQPPQQAKMWDLPPSRIDQISIALAPLRPGLDDPSFAMFDTVDVPYRDDMSVWQTQRVVGAWERIRRESEKIMFGGMAQPVPAAAVPPAGPSPARIVPPATSASGPQRRRSADEAVADLAKSGAEMARALDEARALADAVEASRADANPVSGPAAADPEFDALVNQIDRVPAARDRYRQLLVELGPTGATAVSSRLRLEGYETARQTVQGWLDQDQAAGRVERTEAGWRWIGDVPQ